MEAPLVVQSYSVFCFAQQDEGPFGPSHATGVPPGYKPNSCDEQVSENDWCHSLRLPEPEEANSLMVGLSLFYHCK